jgi:CPA2 family monovalent cation:H+ antiporter-2
MESVRALQQEGLGAVYGDATQVDTLTAAGGPSAGTLVLTSAGMARSAEVIRAARELNLSIRVLARAAYLHDPSARRSRSESVWRSCGFARRYLANVAALLHARHCADLI